MSRRTFVYLNGVAYERGVDPMPETQDVRSQLADGALWGDRHYDGLRAQDGSDISTRTKHREYMARHGLTTADDYTQQWKEQAQERAELFTNGGNWKVRKERREDVGRAIHQVTERNRRSK